MAVGTCLGDSSRALCAGCSQEPRAVWSRVLEIHRERSWHCPGPRRILRVSGDVLLNPLLAGTAESLHVPAVGLGVWGNSLKQSRRRGFGREQ